MFVVKLLANYGSCLHCYIIFWTCRAFSHFTFYISLEVLIIVQSFNNVLTSYVKLYYVHVNFERTNQSYWSSKISQSINVERRTWDRNGKQFFQWKQEKVWSFNKARNVLIKKIEIRVCPYLYLCTIVQNIFY